MTDLREKVIAILTETVAEWESYPDRDWEVAERILAIPEIAEALRLQPVRYLKVGDEK